ncbi:hypothetical protein P7D31_10730 [Enterococcus dongliensis]|uniref:hypothetical protein n=1 Tax=Enterococcus dongliensis TaxID=2559925 RepID=UPI00288D3CD2|nr:hypothetical protein [Enterococcus dongliensis]MDT2604457.1 hypothetical protein [Enterococcus dongliensis]MDT2635513.1 hypothetical protein [Enterococcus dongliensis]MDT2640592.1 hypothetical protein [Enterococcus dongliensis]MDT2645480.1 hypothetical protein [Enterococcus dongliensis]MDT2677043.1 hypothetical protein [Enterococcus dongliensis]
MTELVTETLVGEKGDKANSMKMNSEFSCGLTLVRRQRPLSRRASIGAVEVFLDTNLGGNTVQTVPLSS